MSWFVRMSKNSLFLLIVGTILTASVGTWLNNQYQQRTWEREKRFEIVSRRLADLDRLLVEMPETMKKRLFGLQRYLWGVKSGSWDELRGLWNEYYACVIKWNVELRSHHSRIQRLAGDSLASRFFDYEDPQTDSPSSLHARFRNIHKQIVRIRHRINSGGGDSLDNLSRVEQKIIELEALTDQFIDDLTNVCLDEQASLWAM